MKKKYKIMSKVKKHHEKKMKMESRKVGAANHMRKVEMEKDPCVPNNWPFKEQEVDALVDRRARGVEELEQQRDARKERVLMPICIHVYVFNDVLFNCLRN